ncbi:MAG: HAMP domain-containing histidine kinase [Rhodobacteraceae bacterium]|nr:HAMP domain-containing histidine kinase [Paracoccaceae bacterium]
MRALPRSAAWRIATVTAIAFALATFAIGFAVHRAVHSAFQNQLESNIRQTTASLLAEYRDDGMAGLTAAIEARERSPANKLGFAIFSKDRKRVAGAMDTPMPDAGWRRIVFADPEEGPDPARALSTDLANGMRLTVAADMEPVEAVDETIVQVFFLGSLAVLAIGVILAMGLARYLKQRLERIAVGSRAFVSGDHAVRVQVGPYRDEFDELAASINAMLDRIEDLLGNLRQVTSDLAHDMRTPLTELRGQMEALLRAPDEERDDRVDRAIGQCDEALRLFGAILRISELESGELRKHFKPVDLTVLAGEVVEAHEALAEEEGHRIALATSGLPAAVDGDRDLLAQALVNLVENSLHHTPVGTRIEVGIGGTETAPFLFVRDNGPGIALADMERATRRFVRLDAARTTPGHGLGLSLVKAIAEAHGARMELSDAEPGLEVRMIFGREAA